MRWQITRTLSRVWLVLAVILILIVLRQLFNAISGDTEIYGAKKSYNSHYKCHLLNKTKATVNTESIFPSLKFEPPRSRSFWNESYETRSKLQMNDPTKPPLKVFILPHSHNDPGWLKSFTNYFESDTRKILDLIVEKLMEYEEMKFIWTEISFLDLWWQQATDEQQAAFRQLVKEGRIEIMTGGWVMTDEANVHFHAMLDQLIEGHQWVKSNLDIQPKIGLSIDPFGQASTVPHFLASSGFDGAIIQRIHYSWKEYFAWHQQGDFHWKTLWDSKQSSDYTLLTHNMPFDIYSTKHSCGPRPEECLKFEFRNVPGTWVESQAEDINNNNVQKYSDLLIKQYQDTASLFPHNVALVLVGGDFTYNDPIEFGQQYENYQKLMSYVNNNADRYNNASLQWGTPSEYFHEISNRMSGDIPSLVGDFFPYSDIFSSGEPAYWTGYFTTRPFHKKMSRDLEHNLRNAEILFTIAFNKERNLQLNYKDARRLEKDYELIVKARRNLGLFQHHDAITGTSKLEVTHDYLTRLLSSIKDVLKIQQELIEILVQTDSNVKLRNALVHETVHPSIEKKPSKKIIQVLRDKDVEIFVFNSLAQDRVEAISVHVMSANVKVLSTSGDELPYQVNRMHNSSHWELIFIAKLSALSINSFTLRYSDSSGDKEGQNSSDFMLENDKMILNLNNATGFLESIFDKNSSKGSIVRLRFGGYDPKLRDSGAYLFKPSSEVKKVFQGFSAKVTVTKGPLASDVTVTYGGFLTHKVRIFNSKTHLDNVVMIVNEADFKLLKHRDLEMFMRLKTSIRNGKGRPEFFTDQNGFHWQPRRKVASLGIEANYFPITTSAFMQDDEMRLSLMTTHAQGAASLNEGEIEVMLDRRTSADDGRGMGEGVFDSIKMEHKFYLTLEFFEDDHENLNNYQMPSLLTQHFTHFLNYPVNIFINNREKINIRNEINLFNYKFPCDFHLVNLRTLTDDELEWLPSQSALLILHRFGYDCELTNKLLSNEFCDNSGAFDSIQFVKDLKVLRVERTTLTALESKFYLKSFNDEQIIEPMEIRTYNVSFK